MRYFSEAISKKYAKFSGRARRKEYWTFILITILISLVLEAIDVLAFKAKPILSTIFGLFIIIPSLAIQVRRLHDTNRSWKWLLITIIPGIIASILLGVNLKNINPNDVTITKGTIWAGLLFLILFVGAIVLFVFYLLPGTVGPNKYGEDPKKDERFEIQDENQEEEIEETEGNN